MANRYRRPQSGQSDDYQYRRRGSGQAEQYQQYDDQQFGEGADYGRSRFEDEYGQDSQRQYRQREQSGGYRQQQQDDYDPLGDYDRAAHGGYAGAHRSRSQGGTHSYFRGDDYGGEDYTRGSYGSGAAGTRPSQMRGYGAAGSQSSYGRGQDSNDRGFFAKAGDEIASWFGDEDAERRRQRDHRGRGPANYERSNERLLEDACERLTHDPVLDATNITVTAADKEITLDGTVDSRMAKRRAEDCVHDVSGVKHVQNNLRVVESEDISRSSSRESS